MKRFFLSVVIVLGVAACTSEKDRQQALESEARDALDSTTRDPLSMQVRKVFAKSDDILCGEYNIKGGDGQ